MSEKRSRRSWLWLLCAAAALAALLAGIELPARPETTVYRTLARPEQRNAYAALPDGTIDPNTADAAELTELPGIGETLAAAIIAERENGGLFRFPEDLTAVRGIGTKTLTRFRDMLDFSREAQEVE